VPLRFPRLSTRRRKGRARSGRSACGRAAAGLLFSGVTTKSAWMRSEPERRCGLNGLRTRESGHQLQTSASCLSSGTTTECCGDGSPKIAQRCGAVIVKLRIRLLTELDASDVARVAAALGSGKEQEGAFLFGAPGGSAA
jgi:hypothetical protein